LLFIVEFVDVVAAGLGKDEMEIFAIVVRPVHSIGQQVDQVGVSVVVAVSADDAAAPQGALTIDARAAAT
jgi:hypothetical protein